MSGALFFLDQRPHGQAGTNGRILFGRLGNIVAIESNGTNETILGPGAAPDWHPDGTMVAFTSEDQTDEILLMNSDGSNRRSLATPTRGFQPTWSPDGTKLAFIDAGWDLVIVSMAPGAEGSNPVKVTTGVTFVSSLSWGNTGGSGKLAFSAGEIYVVDAAAGSTPVNITNTPVIAEFDPDWSPDGSRIAFTTSGFGRPELCTMTAAGTDIRRLTTDDYDDVGPSWSPDGTQIVFVSHFRYGFSGDIVAIAAGGGAVRELTTTFDAEGEPDWGTAPAGPPPTPTADVEVTLITPGFVSTGDDFTYTINVRNNGPSDAPSVKLEHQLPAGLNFVRVNSTLCSAATGTVTCADLTVGSGITLPFNITGNVTSPGAVAFTTATHTVVTSTGPADPNLANNAAAPTSFPVRPANDDFARRRVISGLQDSLSWSNVNSTRQADIQGTAEPVHAAVAGGASVWYEWTSSYEGWVMFNTDGSSFDTVLAVYRILTGTSRLDRVAANDDFARGEPTSEVRFKAQAGETYYIAIDGYMAAANTLFLNWAQGANLQPTPTPSQLSSVDPLSVTEGGSAFPLRVLGTGFAPGSKVQVDGQDCRRPGQTGAADCIQTNFISSNELIAQIPASFAAQAGVRTVSVWTGIVRSQNDHGLQVIEYVPISVPPGSYRILIKTPPAAAGEPPRGQLTWNVSCPETDVPCEGSTAVHRASPVSPLVPRLPAPSVTPEMGSLIVRPVPSLVPPAVDGTVALISDAPAPPKGGAPASLIGNDGASLRANKGAIVLANDGASIVRNNRGGDLAMASPAGGPRSPGSLAPPTPSPLRSPTWFRILSSGGVPPVLTTTTNADGSTTISFALTFDETSTPKLSELGTSGFLFTAVSQPAVVEVGAASLQIPEGGGTAQVVVTRTGNTTVPVTVSYATSDGTASAGSDYTAASGTLAFAAGETSKTLTIPIADDAVREASETMDLTLTSPDNTAAFGSIGPTVLTIADNDGGLTPPTVTITSPTGGPGHAASTAFLQLAGTAADDVGVRAITWTTNHGASGNASGTTAWTATVPLVAGTTVITVTATDVDGAAAIDTLTTTAISGFTYHLAEGATGPFFDLDVSIANPNAEATRIGVTFLKEDGTTVTQDRTLMPTSQTTIRADDVAGLADTAVSVVVRSLQALPLIVERTMFWNTDYYGGHGEKAIDFGAQTKWFFAEGSQGFFDTYLLLANATATSANVTVQFLTEGSGTVTRSYAVGPTSRMNVFAGGIAELVGKSFSMVVTSTVPISAERAMYFGKAHFYDGGHEAAGVPAPSTTWLLAEGATGPYFDTFVLVGNPNPAPATLTVVYLLESGATVTRSYTVGGDSRLTINIEDQDPLLANAAVSTRITSDVPVIVERAMYWPGTFETWYEAHNSFGLTDAGTRWGLAEGRVGGGRGFETYILLANTTATDAAVRITYLRTDGTTVVKNHTVAATSRLNVFVNGMVPELVNESFGAVIESTNGTPIAVERALYWNALGVTWAGGTNTTAARIP